MSLLGVYISFEDIYNLIRESLPSPEDFDTKFRQYLFSNSNLLKFQIPGVDVYVKALENAIPRTFLEENAFARNLLDKLIPGLKHRKSNKKVPKNIPLAPKVNVSTAGPRNMDTSPGNVPKDSNTSIKCLINNVPVDIKSPGKAKLRTLGVSTARAVSEHIAQSVHNNFSTCKIVGCTVCPNIWKDSVITKCTHTNPCNAIGLSVHLAKTAILKIHKGLPTASTISGKVWINPCKVMTAAGSSNYPPAKRVKMETMERRRTPSPWGDPRH